MEYKRMFLNYLKIHKVAEKNSERFRKTWPKNETRAKIGRNQYGYGQSAAFFQKIFGEATFYKRKKVVPKSSTETSHYGAPYNQECWCSASELICAFSHVKIVFICSQLKTLRENWVHSFRQSGGFVQNVKKRI